MHVVAAQQPVLHATCAQHVHCGFPRQLAMHRPVSLDQGHPPAMRPCNPTENTARSSPQNSGGQETDGGKAISACGSCWAGVKRRAVCASEALLGPSRPVWMAGRPLRWRGFLLWASSSAFRSSAVGVIDSEASAKAPCAFPELHSNTATVSTSAIPAVTNFLWLSNLHAAACLS